MSCISSPLLSCSCLALTWCVLEVKTHCQSCIGIISIEFHDSMFRLSCMYMLRAHVHVPTYRLEHTCMYIPIYKLEHTRVYLYIDWSVHVPIYRLEQQETMLSLFQAYASFQHRINKHSNYCTSCTALFLCKKE